MRAWPIISTRTRIYGEKGTGEIKGELLALGCLPCLFYLSAWSVTAAYHYYHITIIAVSCDIIYIRRKSPPRSSGPLSVGDQRVGSFPKAYPRDAREQKEGCEDEAALGWTEYGRNGCVPAAVAAALVIVVVVVVKACSIVSLSLSRSFSVFLFCSLSARLLYFSGRQQNLRDF